MLVPPELQRRLMESMEKSGSELTPYLLRLFLLEEKIRDLSDRPDLQTPTGGSSEFSTLSTATGTYLERVYLPVDSVENSVAGARGRCIRAIPK